MISINESRINNQTYSQLNLIFRARMLWINLSMWLRAYLVSMYTGLSYQEAVSRKLYSMPVETGNTLRLFFGDKISEDYITLLSQYIITYQFIFNAQKNGDQAAVDAYIQQLYENIRIRSEYLSKINPFWQSDVWENLMREFASLTIAESTTFLTGDFDTNIKIFDRLITHCTEMGDYLSDGLINYLMLGSGTPLT